MNPLEGSFSWHKRHTISIRFFQDPKIRAWQPQRVELREIDVHFFWWVFLAHFCSIFLKVSLTFTCSILEILIDFCSKNRYIDARCLDIFC